MDIITTNDELRKHVPATLSFDIEEILPYIRNNSVPELIVPSISDAFYQELLTAYDSSSTTSLQDEAIRLIQYISCNYAAQLLAVSSQLVIGESGLHREEYESKKTPYQYQVRDLRQQLLYNAWNGIEQLLGYLESNKGSFGTWTASSAYTEFKETFITSVLEFDRHVKIGQSRYLFQRLKPIMLRTDRTAVLNAIGKDLYDEIKAEISSGTISTDNAYLLEHFIRPAVAMLTMDRAMGELSLQIGHNGVQLVTTEFVQMADAAKAASMEDKHPVSKQWNIEGQQFLSDLSNYLNENASATKYASYFNSDDYTDPDEETEDLNESGTGIAMF